MTCPFLEYRTAADGREFDDARAYCTAADRFVQPMRADVCNDRYDLAHARDCEIYREHADEHPEHADERGDDSDRPDDDNAAAHGGRSGR